MEVSFNVIIIRAEDCSVLAPDMCMIIIFIVI